MKLPRWLDRAYTVCVAIAALVGIPILVILRAQDFGWLNVTLFVLACFLIGLWRGWPAK